MRDKKIGAAAQMLAWLDDVLFPEDVLCMTCERAMDEGDTDGLCRACREALGALADAQAQREIDSAAPAGDEIDYVHAAYLYDGPARRLIHRLKYDSVRAAAIPLGRQMALLPSGEEEIIVPIPTDRRRERRRGFNQATLLAQQIGSELGMEVAAALERTRACRPQTGLTHEQRRSNLRGCMAVRPKAGSAIRGRRVLLVDDVYTTGATAAEAARALKAAGAKSVGLFAAARAWDVQENERDPFALEMV